MYSMGECLASWGVSTVSTVLGYSTKVNEKGLKYRESGSLIEKGSTVDTVSTESFEE
jgi:hypothetical protein